MNVTIGLSLTTEAIAQGLLTLRDGYSYTREFSIASNAYKILSLQGQQKVINKIKLITNNKVSTELIKWLTKHTPNISIQVFAASEDADEVSGESPKHQLVKDMTLDRTVSSPALSSFGYEWPASDRAVINDTEANCDMQSPQLHLTQYNSKASVSGWAQAVRDTHINL
jgi:hypothetical protein